MNGFRKSKGIVIELTALLDVILIMLFWVMMSVRDGSEAEAEAAKQELQAANRVVSELTDKLEQKENEINDLNEFILGIDGDTLAVQEALDGYESGMLITLNIKYDDKGALSISNSDRLLGRTEITSTEDISSCIVESLTKAGLRRSDVILCALIYDGTSSLYKDVITVNEAVEGVRKSYNKFYCAYINTAEKNNGTVN